MDDADLQRLIDGGVYDPAAPDAGERLATIELLDGIGATIDEMLMVAPVPGGLSGLAAIAGMPKPSVTLAEVAARSGIDEAHAIASWRALGLPVGPPDLPVLSTAEAEAIVALHRIAALLSRDAELELLRVAGQSTARLADAFVQTYLSEIEREVDGELARAQLASASSAVLDAVAPALHAVLIRHMTQSAIRLRSGQEGDVDHTRLTVGFVDLVGFTSRSLDASTDDLAHLLGDFESFAAAAVAAHDAWIVKLIGDAVMFAALQPAQAVGVAADLLTRMAAVGSDLDARGGIASGPVLARAGDYFGAVVNLAARAEGEAIEGEVLVDQATAAAVEEPPPGFVLEPAGRRRLRGIAEPVPLWSLHAEAT